MAISDLLFNFLIASFSFSTDCIDIVAGTIKKKGYRYYSNSFHLFSLSHLDRVYRVAQVFDRHSYVAICLVIFSVDYEHAEDYEKILDLVKDHPNAISNIMRDILKLKGIFPLDNVKEFIYKVKPELVGTLGNKKLI